MIISGMNLFLIIFGAAMVGFAVGFRMGHNDGHQCEKMYGSSDTNYWGGDKE